MMQKLIWQVVLMILSFSWRAEARGQMSENCKIINPQMLNRINCLVEFERKNRTNQYFIPESPQAHF